MVVNKNVMVKPEKERETKEGSKQGVPIKGETIGTKQEICLENTNADKCGRGIDGRSWISLAFAGKESASPQRIHTCGPIKKEKSTDDQSRLLRHNPDLKQLYFQFRRTTLVRDDTSATVLDEKKQ